MFLRLSVLFLLISSVATISHAQSDLSGLLPEPDRDFAFWTSASIETKPFRSERLVERQFFRKFRVAAELGYRREENLLRLDQTYIDLSAKYRIKKWFRVAATYRYSMRDKYSINRHRIVVDASFRKKMKQAILNLLNGL